MTAPAVDWTALTTELDHWAAADRVVDFWWRDDDAVAATPALDRLLDLRQTAGVPLALAIIPAQAETGLANRIADIPGIAALQHGFTHHNHAGLSDKKSEFPASRPLALRLADLETGRDRLHALFGSRLLPMLVPPWNRAAEDLLPLLPGLGFRAMSSFTPRTAYWAATGLARLNTQVDPIDWHGGNAAAGAARGLQAACSLLRGMRLGALPLQPVGLLTHHLRHDAAIWDFAASFLAATRHPAARWVDVPTALVCGRPATVMPPS